MLGNFESIGFLLLPSGGVKDVRFTLKDDGGVRGLQGLVGVRSLLDNSLP